VADFISDPPIRSQIPSPEIDGGHTPFGIRRTVERIVETLRDLPDELDTASVSRVLDELLGEIVPDNVLALLNRPTGNESGIDLDRGADQGDAGVRLGSYLVARKAVADVRDAIERVAAEIQDGQAIQSAPPETKPIEDIQTARRLAGEVTEQLKEAAQGEQTAAADKIIDALTGGRRDPSGSSLDWMV